MKDTNLFRKVVRTWSLKTLVIGGKERPSVEVELNHTQERILMMIWHRGSPNMKSLSEDGGLEKGSLTPVIDSLERLGLVKRIKSEKDQRSFEVYPTLAGIRQAEIVEDFYERRLLALLDRLGERERTDFIAALDALGALIPILKGESNERE